jgi:hypothetical protein
MPPPAFKELRGTFEAPGQPAVDGFSFGLFGVDPKSETPTNRDDCNKQ